MFSTFLYYTCADAPDEANNSKAREKMICLNISYILLSLTKLHIVGLNQYLYDTKLLQKSEMRKDIVIELSYKGFSCASDYS